MKNRKKNIEVDMPMRFNPATMSYEPELPLIKSGRRTKIKLDLRFILLLILLLCMMTAFFLIFKNYLLPPY